MAEGAEGGCQPPLLRYRGFRERIERVRGGNGERGRREGAEGAEGRLKHE